MYETENAEEKQHILLGAVQLFRAQRTLILLCMFGFIRHQNGRCYYFCYTLVFLCDIQGSRMFALKVAALICMPMLCYMHVIKIRLLKFQSYTSALSVMINVHRDEKTEAMYTESSVSRLKQQIPVIHNVSVFTVGSP